jgi:hypothetical protein
MPSGWSLKSKEVLIIPFIEGANGGQIIFIKFESLINFE